MVYSKLISFAIAKVRVLVAAGILVMTEWKLESLAITPLYNPDQSIWKDHGNENSQSTEDMGWEY